MSLVSWSEGGLQLTLINRTAHSLGAAGVVIGPHNSMNVSLRKVQGHRSYMSELQTLKANGDLDVQLNGDILAALECGQLDAPLSGEFQAVRDVWNNVLTIDRDGVKTSFTAPAVATTYSGATLTGAYGDANFDYPRNVQVYTVCGGGENTIQKSFVFTGVDLNDQVLQETLIVPAQAPAGNSTTQGLYAFKRVTSVTVPLDTSGIGTTGAHEIGFGKKLGFSKPLTQGGVIAQFVGNVAAAPGTIALATVGLPNGTYSPALDPTDARDWVVVFIPN